jgi:hypothetical protein
MKGHILKGNGRWIALFAIVILLATHGFILYSFASHTKVSSVMAGGVVLLVVARHAGLLTPVIRKLRRRKG